MLPAGDVQKDLNAYSLATSCDDLAPILVDTAVAPAAPWITATPNGVISITVTYVTSIQRPQLLEVNITRR